MSSGLLLIRFNAGAGAPLPETWPFTSQRGTLDYVAKGKMIGEFALLAYPAEYGNSGVMTFLVNHSGTVYQKDLGNSTLAVVKRMMWFDPDHTWKKVDAPKS